MATLTEEQIARHLPQLSGWESSGGAIFKTYFFKNYYETMAFVNAVAWAAHRCDHHPDLEVGYNKCVVRYSTHSEGGVTEADIQSARSVEQLYGAPTVT